MKTRSVYRVPPQVFFSYLIFQHSIKEDDEDEEEEEGKHAELTNSIKRRRVCL